MSDQIEQLLKMLRDAEWTAELAKWVSDVSGYAQSFYYGEAGVDYEYLKGDWDESLLLARDVLGDMLYDFDGIAGRLSPPRIVTGAELREAFEAYLNRKGSGFPGDFSEIYEHFLDHIEYRLLASRSSEEFEVCPVSGLKPSPSPFGDIPRILRLGMALGKAEILGTQPDLSDESKSDPDLQEQAEQAATELVFWSANGIRLVSRYIKFSSDQWKLQSPDADDNSSGMLHARLEGQASPKAMCLLQAELLPILKSVLKSAAALGGGYRVEHLRQSMPFVHGCCQMLFVPPGKKDTMERRFSNAVRLLCEADAQANDAINLALSVTALEALLGRKGRDITKTLAESIAALLEPKLENRLKASKFVEDLYDLRCRVLHGENVEGRSGMADTARRLAAGVLYGVWFRRDFLMRYPEKPETPDKLLEELQEHKYRDGLPVGVADVPAIRRLWSTEDQKDAGGAP